MSHFDGRMVSDRMWFVVLVALAAAVAAPVAAQENDDCLMCHEDPDLVGERGGSEFSVHVDPEAFAASVHADFACIDCHMDLDGVELPHEEELEVVDCGMCHDDMAEDLLAGPHGKWAADPMSPSAACSSCHGVHDVLSDINPESPTAACKVNDLCARCHASDLREVSGSPHGRQLGDRPAAGCSDCHRGHNVTAPTEPSSAACLSAPLRALMRAISAAAKYPFSMTRPRIMRISAAYSSMPLG